MSKECYNCDKRHPGCHSTCESYLQYRAKLDAEKKERQKQKRSDRLWDMYALYRENTIRTRLNRKSHNFKSKRK